MADESDLNILLLFLHGIPDNGNQKFLDRLLGTIPQVVKTLSFGEFRLSPVENGEYTFCPVLLIREPRFALEGPRISFRDAEVLFLEERGRNQLRAG